MVDDESTNIEKMLSGLPTIVKSPSNSFFDKKRLDDPKAQKIPLNLGANLLEHLLSTV